jgi:hypothetical protein
MQLDGRTLDDIATAMGLKSPSSAQYRVNTAIDTLRRRLAPDDFAELLDVEKDEAPIRLRIPQLQRTKQDASNLKDIVESLPEAEREQIRKAEADYKDNMRERLRVEKRPVGVLRCVEHDIELPSGLDGLIEREDVQVTERPNRVWEHWRVRDERESKRALARKLQTTESAKLRGVIQEGLDWLARTDDTSSESASQ